MLVYVVYMYSYIFVISLSLPQKWFFHNQLFFKCFVMYMNTPQKINRINMELENTP